MHKHAELIETLRELSHISSKLATMLESPEGILRSDPIVIGIPPCHIVVDVDRYTNWPLATAAPAFESINGGTCLAVVRGESTLPIESLNTHVDIICDNLPSRLPLNYSIVRSDEADGPYDHCVLYETLEFCTIPESVLQTVRRKMKSGGKIHIRFRPWTACNGGFIDNKLAFVHLATDASNSVINKVTKPLATYEQLLSGCGMSTIRRQVHSTYVDAFFDELMPTIMERTWSSISKDEARKIMAITAVDYVLQT